MKRILLSLLMLAICLWANSQSVHCGVSATMDGGNQQWVQLWIGGPRWAMFNVGSGITDYAEARFSEARKSEKYASKNIGGHYAWGGKTDGGYNDVSVGIRYLHDGLDTATELWGENWRMPTMGELLQLKERCDWEWIDGVNKQYVEKCTLPGYKITGRGTYKDDSIFLPAAGYNLVGKAYGLGKCGLYWSSESSHDVDGFAQFLNFGVEHIDINYQQFDRYSFSIRAVCK